MRMTLDPSSWSSAAVLFLFARQNATFVWLSVEWNVCVTGLLRTVWVLAQAASAASDVTRIVFFIVPPFTTARKKPAQSLTLCRKVSFAGGHQRSVEI